MRRRIWSSWFVSSPTRVLMTNQSALCPCRDLDRAVALPSLWSHQEFPPPVIPMTCQTLYVLFRDPFRAAASLASSRTSCLRARSGVRTRIWRRFQHRSVFPTGSSKRMRHAVDSAAVDVPPSSLHRFVSGLLHVDTAGTITSPGTAARESVRKTCCSMPCASLNRTSPIVEVCEHLTCVQLLWCANLCSQ